MKEKKTASSKIKSENRQLIYSFIRKHGPVSKQDIVVGLGLSLPTVTQNLVYLESEKLIDTSHVIKNTGGRNATAYTPVNTARFAVGLFLTANHITAVSVDLTGTVICMNRERVHINLNDDNYLKTVGNTVEQILTSTGLPKQDLLGVGIAVPGIITEDGETVRNGVSYGFTGKTRSEISRYIPYPTRLFHDSFVSGFAEVWVNPSINNALYVNLNNTIGGSLIIGNKIFHGINHQAGDIGHMIIVPKGGRRCYCGQYGCFDTVCNASILESYSGESLSAFFDLLRGGDPGAARIWEEYINYLCIAIHNLQMFINTPIILGGYVGEHIDEYKEQLYRKLDELSSLNETSREYLLSSNYKIESTAAGAAIVLIDEFMKLI